MKILKIFFAIVIFLGFSLLTFLLNIDGFNELSILTGLIALMGIAMLFMGKKKVDTNSPQVIQPSQSVRSESLKEQEVANVSATVDAASTIQAVAKDEVAQPIVNETAAQQTTKVTTISKIPEDSVLRRHFISHMRSLIENELPDRPTDSVLKRHYETLVSTELEDRLANL